MATNRIILIALFAVSSCSIQESRETQATVDVERIVMQARLQTLNAEILGSRSATAVLERWCRRFELADDPVIRVDRIHDQDKLPSTETLARLQVTDANEVKYRRVHLRCGGVVMSKADNWYVPSRLTTAMNAALDTTDTPFGKVVAALQPFRQTIESRLLWSPWPMGSDCAETVATISSSMQPPPEIFQHRAVLYSRDLLPFSEVVETYQGAALTSLSAANPDNFPVSPVAAPTCH
jgi:hypothetical protein